MPRLFVAILALVVLTACTTRAANQNIVTSWYGADYVELVEAWGLPTSIEERDDGSRLAVWSEYHAPEPIGPPAFIILDNILPENLRRPRHARETPEKTCEARLFITPDGRVEFGIWSGDGCPPRPARGTS